jgi:hypothetical protein
MDPHASFQSMMTKLEAGLAEILLAHAPAATETAERVAAKLAALGYSVKPSQPVGPLAGALAPQAQHELDRAVASAACVLVLWSREAARTPGMLSTAKSAKAAGKLAVARLDASAPPLRLAAANLSAWKGRTDARAWRKLMARLPKARGAVAKVRTRVSRSGTSPAKPRRWMSGALAFGIFAIGALAAAAAALRYLPQGR